MKRLLLLVPALLLGSLFSLPAHATLECGAGKITHIKEGHNNTDDLLIAIDYSVGPFLGEWLVEERYIRFKKDSMSSDRFRGIKAIIYMAYSSDSFVFIKSFGAGCGGANYIRILRPGTDLEPAAPVHNDT